MLIECATFQREGTRRALLFQAECLVKRGRCVQPSARVVVLGIRQRAVLLGQRLREEQDWLDEKLVVISSSASVVHLLASADAPVLHGRKDLGRCVVPSLALDQASQVRGSSWGR